MASIMIAPQPANTSANEPTAKLENGKITVNWNAVVKKGNAKIRLATTNNFKTGGKDDYKKVAEAPLSKQEAVIDVTNNPSSFYKIVIETPTNILNRWIVVK